MQTKVTDLVAAQAQPQRLRPWRCPRCDAQVGQLMSDERLFTGGVIINRGDFECGNCGYEKHWNPALRKLEQLVERRLDAARQ